MTRSDREASLKPLILLFLAFSVAKAAPVPLSVQAESAGQFGKAVWYFNSAEYRKALALFDKIAPADSVAGLNYYRGVCLFFRVHEE